MLPNLEIDKSRGAITRPGKLYQSNTLYQKHTLYYGAHPDEGYYPGVSVVSVLPETMFADSVIPNMMIERN